MSVKKIWYISKYAVTKRFGNPTRQYFFSKYFSQQDKKVKLISSKSSIISTFPDFGKGKSLLFKDADNLEEILLNGPLISLGFNLKRILSWFVFEVRLLLWAKKQERPDVIIVSSLSLLSFLSGILIKRKYKCKLICEVRDIWPLTLIEMKEWSKFHPLVLILGAIEKFGYRQADAIVGTMPNLAEHVKNVCPGQERKVYHIPTGFDPEFWEDEKWKKEPSDLDVNKSFVVGYAGTLGTANCIDQILEASRLLKNYSIDFFIMGNGPLKDSLIQQKLKEDLSNVYFFDAVPKGEVQSFLSQCDLLLNPWRGSNKLYKYGVSPNKWIDYMYSGKPILVSLNGYRSIINEAGCGRFIDADDPGLLAQSILEFAQLDKDELCRMGEKGKQYLLQNLTYKILTKQYLEIIDNL